MGGRSVRARDDEREGGPPARQRGPPTRLALRAEGDGTAVDGATGGGVTSSGGSEATTTSGERGGDVGDERRRETTPGIETEWAASASTAVARARREARQRVVGRAIAMTTVATGSSGKAAAAATAATRQKATAA